MKKSLIALAVLASAGAAMAQSSVTLYGIVDINLQSSKDQIGAASTAAVRQTTLSSGGVSTSRWGLKGAEDLGGGLKANFVLENGFDSSTGKANGNLFDRQSWVGLSGGFGEVRLGNDYTARDDINGAAHAVFDSAFSPSAFIESGYNSNPLNQIKYLTPNLGGFSAAVSYALGENKTATTSAKGVAAINVQYAAGPLYIGFAHQNDKKSLITSGETSKDNFLNATYDLGVAKILASAREVKNTTGTVSFDKQRVYQIGADVPVGASLVVSAGYAHSKSELAGSNDVTGDGFAVGASYSLSKRTSIYTALNASKAKQDGAADLKTNVYAVGVRHAF